MLMAHDVNVMIGITCRYVLSLNDMVYDGYDVISLLSVVHIVHVICYPRSKFIDGFVRLRHLRQSINKYLLILAKYLPIGMFYVSTYVDLPFDDFFVIIFIAIILLLSLSYMSILSLSDLHSFIRLKHGIGNSRRSIFLFCQTITSSCL